jgi:hypothetical protein
LESSFPQLNHTMSYVVDDEPRVCLMLQEGMGKLRVVAGGIQLNGQAMVLDALVASTIRSRRGQPISIDSSRNFSVNARDHDGRIVSQLYLGENTKEIMRIVFVSEHINIKLMGIPYMVFSHLQNVVIL